jgi:hypothetical protein
MANRELPAVLLMVTLIGVVPPVNAGEPSERPVSNPRAAISDLPEDQRLAAIIEQVEQNEELYKNLEARIRTQYDVGDRQTIDHEIVRTDFVTVFVSQNGMFRVETQGATFLVDGPNSRHNTVHMFDGEATRFVRRKGSDPQESAAREDEVIRPHTLLRRYVRVTGPLSENLRGGPRKWARGMEEIVSYRGVDEYQGLNCHIVRFATARADRGNPPSNFSELWLAEKRNFLPIRLRLFALQSSADVPVLEGEVDTLRELKNGVWFPGHAVVKSFDPNELSATGKQKLQWRYQYSLSNVSLDPDHERAFFQDDRIPSRGLPPSR